MEKEPNNPSYPNRRRVYTDRKEEIMVLKILFE